MVMRLFTTLHMAMSTVLACKHFRSLANCCCCIALHFVQITVLMEILSMSIHGEKRRGKEDARKEMKKKVQHSAANLADQQDDAQPANCWAMQLYSNALYSTADMFLVALKRRTVLK